jgi:hypothetical protein
MLPVLKLSHAWLHALGWSYDDAAFVLDVDLAGAAPPGEGDRCPRCSRGHADYQIQMFVPDLSTETLECVYGRAYVLCVCNAMYWYSAVCAAHAEVQAVSEVRTTTKIQPGTAAPLELEGQTPEILPPGRGFVSVPSPPYWYRPGGSLYFTPAPPPEPGAGSGRPPT